MNRGGFLKALVGLGVGTVVASKAEERVAWDKNRYRLVSIHPTDGNIWFDRKAKEVLIHRNNIWYGVDNGP